MLLYQCSKCGKQFSAINPKVCPYCKHEYLQIMSNYKVQVYNTLDVKSVHNTYATKLDLHPDLLNNKNAIADITCKILQLPSISIRHCIDHPFRDRFKKNIGITKELESPFTVELRLYSPKRAYVLIDSESDEIIDYLIKQYKSMGWGVLNLSKSNISFTKIIRDYLKTHIVPRIENKVVQKDIQCLINNDGGKSDNNHS